MTQEAKRTPTPWAIDAGHNQQIITTLDKSYDIAIVRDIAERYDNKANAEFIVRACNAHDELVELAMECLWRRDYPNGGSIVKTWADNQYQDREFYRKEVLRIVGAA